MFRPEDTFAGTLLGMVEALDAGITTVVDWSHNLNSPDHADAAWDALQQGGGRPLFSYGATNDQALRRDSSPHARDVARLRNGVGADDDARVTLGMALRGPEFSERGGRFVDIDVRSVIERATESHDHLLAAAGVADQDWCPPALQAAVRG